MTLIRFCRNSTVVYLRQKTTTFTTKPELFQIETKIVVYLRQKTTTFTTKNHGKKSRQNPTQETTSYFGIDCFTPKIVDYCTVWAVINDREIYSLENGLKEKIPEGKVIVCDRVYTNKESKTKNEELALPNLGDNSQRVANLQIASPIKA